MCAYAGTILGQTDFFLRRPRTAMVVAGGDPCTLFVVPRAAFDTLRLKSPEVSPLPACHTAPSTIDCRTRPETWTVANSRACNFWLRRLAGTHHPNDRAAARCKHHRGARRRDAGSQPGVTAAALPRQRARSEGHCLVCQLVMVLQVITALRSTRLRTSSRLRVLFCWWFGHPAGAACAFAACMAAVCC